MALQEPYKNAKPRTKLRIASITSPLAQYALFLPTLDGSRFRVKVLNSRFRLGGLGGNLEDISDLLSSISFSSTYVRFISKSSESTLTTGVLRMSLDEDAMVSSVLRAGSDYE
jgi:hypothetical protein